MGYNKRQFQKTNDKKVLHKVRKHWVVVSLAMLMAIGGGALATHTASANADATNANNGNNVNNTQSIKESLNSKLQSNQANVNANQNNNQANANQNNQKVNSNAIQQRAEALHNEILGNAAQHQAANNANANNASQSNQNANASAQQQPSVQGRQAAPQVNNNGVKANVPSHKGFGAVKLGNPNGANLNNNQVAVDQNSDKQSANAPKRLLGDTPSGSSSNSNNGNSDSHVELNENDPYHSNVLLKYNTKAGQTLHEIEQTGSPNLQFDLSADRTGGIQGYHYTGIKGTTISGSNINGVNLATVDKIPFPALGKTDVINIQIAPDAQSKKVPSSLTYVFQNADNGQEISQTTNYGDSGDPIANPQSFVTQLPAGYKLQSIKSSNPSAFTISNNMLPVTMPAGNNQVFINLKSTVKPTVSSSFEYVDEGTGQIVGDEQESGEKGTSIKNFSDYQKFVPSGYTYDGSNAMNNASHWNSDYTEGNVNYIYVKSNRPEDQTNGYVNIIFKDKRNSQIIDQRVMTGRVNTPVNLGNVKNMVPQHYNYDSADGNNPVVSQYTNNLQNLTYYVDWDNSNIPSTVNETINYADYANPSHIYGTETVSGKPSSLINWNQYTTVLPQGTQFVRLGKHDTSFVDGGNSTVYVKSVSTQPQPITVQYINQHGQKVASDKVTGDYGQNFSDITKNPASPIPQGYNLTGNDNKPINQNYNYTVGSDAQTVNIFVNGDQYTVNLPVKRNVNGKATKSDTVAIKGRVGDSEILNASSYNPDNSSDMVNASDNPVKVTMNSKKDPSNGNQLEGTLNPASVAFNYTKISYNTPGYHPEMTPSDNGSKDDYHPASTKAYPSDNSTTNAPTNNSDKVPSGYVPGWVPSDPTKPNGNHTNGYVPTDHIPKGYVPGYVPNGKGGYVPGYVDPNNLPSGSKNGNGKNNTVPKYIAGNVPNGQGGTTPGLVPAGTITIHYINASDASHNDIDTEAVSGQPNKDFDISSYTKNLPSGYVLNSVDYGTDNYSNAGTPITKFSGNDEDVNVMVNKMATATLNYVNQAGATYPGMSRTLNGISGTNIDSTGYENYLPLGYVLDKNQPSASQNNNWKLANGKTYQIVVDRADVAKAQPSDGYGEITLNYVDTNPNDANHGKTIATVSVMGKDGTDFSDDTTDYNAATTMQVPGYTNGGFNAINVANNMKFNKNTPQSLQVDLAANGTTIPSDISETIQYVDASNNKQIGTRNIKGKNGSTIDWSPYEEYLPATGGQYWSFDRLGTHNNTYNGGPNVIYLLPATRVHHNATPGYDPDNTMNTTSDYFPSTAANSDPYQTTDPSDPSVTKGREAANGGNSDGGMLPANYVPGWVPNPAQKGSYMPGYIPSDNIPQGYIPGQVPNNKGGYVPGYVDPNNLPTGKKNGNNTVPKYVPGIITDKNGHKTPGLVPATNGSITIHYIDADNGNKAVNTINLTGDLDQAFDVSSYQNDIPQGYSYMQTNYGLNNYDKSGKNNGTAVTKYTDNSQDVDIMLHETASATINYKDQNQNIIATKKLSGRTGSSVNKGDFINFIPYGYSLSSNPTSGSWTYNNTSDTVNLVNQSDAAKTPSDSKSQNLGYIELIYKNGNKVVGDTTTSAVNGSAFSPSDVNTYMPENYADLGYLSQIPSKYDSSNAQKFYINVGLASDNNGGKETPPTHLTDTIYYVDADHDMYNGSDLAGKLIASTTISGKPGTPIDYSQFKNNLPSAKGGNWAYDFMGSHDSVIGGHGNTIYIHKAQPAQQYGVVNIDYKDAKTHSDRGSNSVVGTTGSQFDITKYEADIPNNGSDVSDQYTFARASDVPNFFNSDDINGQNMTVYVNEPAQKQVYSTVNVVYKNLTTGNSSTPTSITGTIGSAFSPASFENNLPQGTSYSGVENPVYSFAPGAPQTMTIDVTNNG